MVTKRCELCGAEFLTPVESDTLCELCEAGEAETFPTRSEQVRELREAFDGLASEAWRFYGLTDNGGGAYCWRFDEVGGQGYILVSGDDTLASDGAPESFGSSVTVGQYIYDEETGDYLTPEGEPTEWAWRDFRATLPVSYDEDGETVVSPEIVDYITVVVRAVFKRWGVI